MDESFRALERKVSVQKAEDIAETTRDKAEDMANRIAQLEGAIESLTVISRALWQIAKEGSSLSDQVLRERVDRIRAEQAAEREHPKPAPPCKNCHRPLEKGRDTCIYCGAVRDDHNVFDAVL